MSDFPEELTRSLAEFNALRRGVDVDGLTLAVRELELRAQIIDWSRDHPDESGQHIVLNRPWIIDFTFGREDNSMVSHIAMEDEIFVPFDLRDCFDELSRSFNAISSDDARRSDADRQRLATIDRGLGAMRRVIAYDNGIEDGEVVSELRVDPDGSRWVFVFRPNLDDFAQGAVALNHPQVVEEPFAEIVELPEDLAVRSNALIARQAAGAISDEERDAIIRDFIILRNDIARATGREAGGLDLQEARWIYRPMERGDDIRLPPNMVREVERLNARVPAAPASEWDVIRDRVAQLAGLPVSQIVRDVDSSRVYFIRSMIPNDGEMENGQTLPIPRFIVLLVRNAFRESDTARRRAALDGLIRDMAEEYRLPPGRVVVEQNPQIRFVYREPVAGQPLPIPFELNDMSEGVNRQIDPVERQVGIIYLQAMMARHYGFDPSDLELVTSSGRIEFQQRRAEVHPPANDESSPHIPGQAPANDESSPHIRGQASALANDPRQAPAVARDPRQAPVVVHEPAHAPEEGSQNPAQAPREGGLGQGRHSNRQPLVPLSKTGSNAAPKILAVAGPGSDDTSLSTGAIVGIVIGSISGLILIIILIVYIRKVRSRKNQISLA